MENLIVGWSYFQLLNYKLAKWIMLGLHLFSSKSMVEEKVFFKYNHYLYLARYFKDGSIELWAVAARKPYEWQLHEYNLGKLAIKEWIRQKGFYNYEYAMQRSAHRLYQVILKEIDRDENSEYTRSMTGKKKKEWTREDFVREGKKGHEAMLKKYGKPAVAFRWEKKKNKGKA